MKIKDKSFYSILRDYLTVYLPYQKESRPNTVKSYREGLNMYLTFISDFKKIRICLIGFMDMSPENLEAFVKWLSSERRCGASSINQRIAIICAFLKYAGMRQPELNMYYLQIQRIPFKKSCKDLTVDHFSEEALKAILNQPKPQKKTEHRNLFYLILLYDTGARNQELLDLRASDFITFGKSAHIITPPKSNEE